VHMGGETWNVDVAAGVPFDTSKLARPGGPLPENTSTPTKEVPLVALAWGRSGDKGNNANIGILAREPDYLPYIRAALTEEAVARYFAHFLEGRVERFDLPGVHGVNFLLHDVLGGGGMASLRNDPQGKTYAQMLLDFPVPVPDAIAARVNA
jgi:hypothetical protein